MFRICIILEGHNVTGLDALDERRRLKLPDASEAAFVRYRTVEAEVSEGFARAYFGRNDRVMTFAVHHSLLVPGDVVETHSTASDRHNVICFAADMSADRVRELWIAARDRWLTKVRNQA